MDNNNSGFGDNGVGAASEANIKETLAAYDQPDAHVANKKTRHRDRTIPQSNEPFFNEPGRESSKPVSVTTVTENITKEWNQSPPKGKTKTSNNAMSTPNNKKGRLTFSKRAQERFIQCHLIWDSISAQPSSNDVFLDMIIDHFLEVHKREIEDSTKKIFKI